ncbi:MAG: DNA polymerase III subunit gamma/tau [Pseudochelatococcus sp.]|jgi:DNA polymerase-3 subunit gamma/tau|uniref:DNA polymerase III subunit gamma/tau n=1 Tax=Pseudochelatococcus sp. TaxID=2020869 RepID=UPI003D94A189
MLPHRLPGVSRPDGAVTASPNAAYRVLARKYRPRSFGDLIGQDAMVRTLSNAFEAGRIPQAWMLTGVRGVGKTTTARILARALNFIRADGSGGPTVHLDETGVHCDAIMESRHVDVMEMDAASHTGIDDVRQIIDGIRYAPVSARYKVYIIDEVHMLSEKAFNAFLKTLEEPPPHAKFVFATTEIRKVPVTILSRCQRFDLRRVEAGALRAHLAAICAAESVAADAEALALIARAAEGSVRDSLSLLDQAIAHGAGKVAPEEVKAMLGLADRARVIDLFEALMRGDIAAALAELAGQYDAGADPAVVLADLAAVTHLVTRFKLVPEAANDAALTDVERARGAELAGRLSVRALSRTWQILVKGLPEVQAAPQALAAAEMVLVRLAYAADLPSPEEALRLLRENGAGERPSGAPAGGGSPSSGGGARLALAAGGGMSDPIGARAVAQPVARAEIRREEIQLARFEDVVALAGERRDIGLKAALERDVRLVRYEQGVIELALVPGANPAVVADLGNRLLDWTGRRWVVALSSAEGAPTIAEMKRAREQERQEDARAHPLVQAVMARFPGAIIVDVRDAAPDDAAADGDADSALATEAHPPYIDD